MFEITNSDIGQHVRMFTVRKESAKCLVSRFSRNLETTSHVNCSAVFIIESKCSYFEEIHLNIQRRNYNNLFRTYAKFSEKLRFLAP